MPTKLKLPVSGTVLTSVVVAKHVAEGAQNDPATWRLPSVIPLAVSALVSTRNNDWAVADPLASKQRVPVAPGVSFFTSYFRSEVRAALIALTGYVWG